MRVSDVARSYDMEIIKALLRGEPTTAEELERAKAEAIHSEKELLELS